MTGVEERAAAVREVCHRYQRMTGRNPVGLGDIIRILVGPDMAPLMADLLAQPTAEEAEGDSREVLADVLRSANLKSLLAGHGRADAIDLADAAIAAGYRRAALATPPAPERNGLGGGSENPDSHEWLGTDR